MLIHKSNTDPPGTESSGSNVDLFGSGQGYRPGHSIYAIDGLVVPESQFLQVINSGLIGGAFGLLEIAARMSAQVTVRTSGGRVVGTFDNAGAIPDNFRAGIRQGELSASYTHNNWSAILSLIPQGQQTGIDSENPADLAPKGTASTTKLTAVDCDKKLARLFGGPDAVVGSTHDPLTLGAYEKALENSRNSSGLTITITGARGNDHGPNPVSFGDRGGIIHVYGDPRGNEHGPIFSPAGGKATPLAFDKLGNQYRRVHYNTGLSITFVHVEESKSLAKNPLGSQQIGLLGGPGGDTKGYVHSHLIFYSNFNKGIRVDPRKVFCGS